METTRMAFTLPTKNIGGGAPPVEDGLALARFDDLVQRHIPAFVTEKDRYDKPDDGNRLEFQFTLVDEVHDVVYHEGDPIELRNGKSCKPSATGEKSNFYAYLSGLLTPAEMAAYEAQTEEEPADLSSVPGRVYNVKIGHNKQGWPQIDDIIGVAKAPKAAK